MATALHGWLRRAVVPTIIAFGASSAAAAPVEHAVLVVGETAVDTGRFTAIYADETRAAVPAKAVHVFRDPEGLLYFFDLNQPLDRVCIGEACAVFVSVPERNGRFALFPAGFDGRADTAEQQRN